MKLHAFTILSVSLLCAAAFADYEPVELPVSRVVLFSSGVGYFQHEAAVKDDAQATLSFETDQMNDVLKSMVLMDFGGGTISSVGYASRDPLERALKSFAVDISDDPELAELLDRLRGARVVLEAPRKITGTILGVESHRKQVIVAGTATIIEEAVMNIVTDDGIRSMPLSDIQNIRLGDERLAGELDQALALLLASRDTRRKGVTIRFTGKGKRDVSVGYIAEAPVWKTSYRLVLTGRKPGIQGWAIVENTTDADWRGVKLALVSGRPISFIQDLYTPLYLPRPVVKPKLYAALRPRLYAEGIEREAKMAADAVAGVPARELKARREGLAGLEMARAAVPTEAGAMRGHVALNKGVGAIAAAQEVGELFRFAIEAPVDLPRRQSAMLPIINCPIAVEKVSIYNASVLQTHPLNGAYLTNDTDLKMPAGPVTVFDEGIYAGDAQIDNLVPGDKRLISYAVDLNVSVDSSEKTSSRVVSGRIDRGALYITHRRLYTQRYVLKNKSDQPRQVIIEHPYHIGRKLLAPAEYEEKTPQLYRFRVPVKAGSTRELAVETEQIYSQTAGIVDSDIDLLLRHSKSGQISNEVRQALEQAIRIRQRAATLAKKIDDLSAQKRDIEAGQERLRRNISTAGRTSELAKRYLRKLGEQEDRIESLQAAIDEARGRLEATEAELHEYLDGLKVD